MKTLTRIIFSLLFTVIINAQTLNIYTKDGGVYQIEISSIDSITFQETASITQNIDGVMGGIIEYNRGIINAEGKVVQVDARLEIPANAFIGNRNISMNVNVDSGYISFSPNLDFNVPCDLNFGLMNMDLIKLGFTSSANIANFVYIDDAGAIFPVINQGIIYDFDNGILKVNSAKIDHFSRYGFVR